MNQMDHLIDNINTFENFEVLSDEENEFLKTIYAKLMDGYFYKIGEYKKEERAKYEATYTSSTTVSSSCLLFCSIKSLI